MIYTQLPCVVLNCLVVSDSLQPLFRSPPGSSVHGDSPGKNTGVGCLALLRGIFPTQGSNPSLLHYRKILYCLSHHGSSRILEWVAYPFCRGSSQTKNWTGVSHIASGFCTSWATKEPVKSESCSVVTNSLQPHRLYSPWNSSGQNTGVGSRSPLQGIFPTKGSNPGLPHCRQILYQLSHQRSPRILEWVAYPVSSGSSRPRNGTSNSFIAGRFFTRWDTGEALGNNVAQLVKNLLAMQETLGWEDPLETYVQSLGWENPWKR